MTDAKEVGGRHGYVSAISEDYKKQECDHSVRCKIAIRKV